MSSEFPLDPQLSKVITFYHPFYTFIILISHTPIVFIRPKNAKSEADDAKASFFACWWWSSVITEHIPSDWSSHRAFCRANTANTISGMMPVENGSQPGHDPVIDVEDMGDAITKSRSRLETSLKSHFQADAEYWTYCIETCPGDNLEWKFLLVVSTSFSLLRLCVSLSYELPCFFWRQRVPWNRGIDCRWTMDKNKPLFFWSWNWHYEVPNDDLRCKSEMMEMN